MNNLPDKKIIEAPSGNPDALLYDPKIRSAMSLGNAIQTLRGGRNRVRIGFTNGKFRVLHPHHCVFLSLCRTRCDILVVAVNSDYSLRMLKEESKFQAKERAFAIASLGVVDYVTIFDEETPHLVIPQVNPDVIFKGADYADKEVISMGKPVEIISHPFNVHAADLDTPPVKFFNI